MGKANRNKQADQEARRLSMDRKKQAQADARKKEQRSKAITILCTVLVAALLLGVLAYNWMLTSGFFMRQNIAASTENYKLDQTHASYYYNSIYSQYSSMASYLGIDTTTSLKNQACSFAESGTWFDYFMSQAKTDMNNILIFCEEAKARGIELDAADKKSIDDAMDALKKAAKQAGVSTSYYIHAVYGEGVSKKDVREALEMATLYSKCCEEIYATYQYTADDYKKYRDANEDALKEIDYLAFDMTIDDSTVSGEITSTTLWGYDKRFSKAANEEEFKAVIRDYLTNYTYRGKEDAETSIENDIANCLVENATKQEDDTGFFEWAFSGSRKAGDVFTYINEDKTKQTAYFLITPASIDESKTVNVRHILLTADQFGSAEAAKAKAEELLAQWQGGAATAESFGELAKEYSADNSASNGGLIENVNAGAMVENFDAWLFADGRKAGDSGIVETEYGYHVMYMDGEGLVAWEAAVDKTLKDARWAEEQAAVSQKFAVTFNDAVLAAVNG